MVLCTAVCILICSTSYSFYWAVYSGLWLLPCYRGKQPSKFQAASLSLGFHLSCCSFWSSSQSKVTASPPCAVLQVHSCVHHEGVRSETLSHLLFSLFACPGSGLSLLSAQALLIPSVNISLLKHTNFPQSFTENYSDNNAGFCFANAEPACFSFPLLLSPYCNIVSLNFHLQGVPGSI